MKSIIETMILDRSFDYLQPYFYSNPYALRCELGTGDSLEASRRQARNRAEQIYHLLFPERADAILFSHWIYDWSDTGDAEGEQGPASRWEEIIEGQVNAEMRRLRFLLTCMMHHRHVSVKGLKTYEDPRDPEAGSVRRNRMVCYADGTGFQDLELITRQIRDEDNLEIGLVSFRNECILSVYDDRGCDIVFSTYEKMREFYPLLKPFFLPYDLEEMERRLSRGR